MRRWLIPLLLLVVVVGGFLLYRFGRPARFNATTSSLVEDPNAHATMAEGMKAMGYEGKGFSGYDWRNEPCDYHNYLVRPSISKADPFFIVRSRKTGEMHFLRGSELDRILKQYVTYDGRFLGLPRGTGDSHEYYSLGSTMRDGTQVFVYVGFDEKACGLMVDDVWYWAPGGREGQDQRATAPLEVR